MRSFTSKSGKQLYNLMPAFYRQLDNTALNNAQNQQDISEQLGDLALFLDSCGELLDLQQHTLQQRLADSFPDNPESGPACQDWLIPYFARLLDARLVSPHVEGQRDEVANAISWRQSKGTLNCVEQIAEAITLREVEVREGWQRVAVTPRVATPLLPTAVYGIEHNINANDQYDVARHPGLPAATIDFRCPSRAVLSHKVSPATRSREIGGVPYSWVQANPHGVPASPGSFDDVSRRTVDLRTENWRQGHTHPKRALIYTPVPMGLFPRKAITLSWAEVNTSAYVNFVYDEPQDHFYIRNRSKHSLIINDSVIELQPSGPEKNTRYTIEDFQFNGKLQMQSGRMHLKKTVVREVGVNTEYALETDPVLFAEDCLIGNINIPRGSIKIQSSTLMDSIICLAIFADNSIFNADIIADSASRNPPNTGRFRYSRIPENLQQRVESLGAANNLIVETENCTTEAVDFFDSDYDPADENKLLTPDTGLLSPDIHELIGFGAEDGSEMGAYHKGRELRPVTVNKPQDFILTQSNNYSLKDLVFADSVSVTTDLPITFSLERVSVPWLEVNSDAIFKNTGSAEQQTPVPVVIMQDSLIKDLSVIKGLAQLEYCTVLNNTTYNRLWASDCIFDGNFGNSENGIEAFPKDCIRYSRIPADIYSAATHPETQFPFCTDDKPVFFHSDFTKAINEGEPGCGVLHDASSEAIRFGGEDGGEMGAYHNVAYSLQAEALHDKLEDYLPVGISPVLVIDKKLNNIPLKASEPGDHIWSRAIGSEGQDIATRVVIDRYGNAIAVGVYKGDLNKENSTQWHLVFFKYDTYGNLQWKRNINTGVVASVNDIAVDSQGHIIITGQYNGVINFGEEGDELAKSKNFDIYLVKLDEKGQHIWSHSYASAQQENSMGVGVSVDFEDKIILTGEYRGDIDFGGGKLNRSKGSDVFLAKFQPNGDHIWSYGFTGAGADNGWRIDTNKKGDIYLVGTFEKTIKIGDKQIDVDNSRAVFLAAFDADGTPIWLNGFEGENWIEKDNWIVTTGIVVDQQSNVIICGHSYKPINLGGEKLSGEDNVFAFGFVAKFTSEGKHLWSKIIETTSWSNAVDVDVDRNNNIVIAGHVGGTLKFSGREWPAYETTDEWPDGFVLCVDASGNYRWLKRFGKEEFEFSNAVAIDALGDVVFTGSFQDVVNFGGKDLLSSDERDAYIAKLTGIRV